MGMGRTGLTTGTGTMMSMRAVQGTTAVVVTWRRKRRRKKNQRRWRRWMTTCIMPLVAIVTVAAMVVDPYGQVGEEEDQPALPTPLWKSCTSSTLVRARLCRQAAQQVPVALVAVLPLS